MILSNFGQPPQSYRIPFRRPPGAGFFTPRMPGAAMQTHLNPWQSVLPAMVPLAPRLPGTPYGMEPGGPSAALVARTAMPRPSSMGMAGFGFPGRGIHPYNVMRTGMIPGIVSSGAGMRMGIRSAPQLIQRLTPGAYTGTNVPAGGY